MIALKPDFVQHIQCTGDESRLMDCTIIPIYRNLCDENEVAGVECDIGINNIFDLIHLFIAV